MATKKKPRRKISAQGLANILAGVRRRTLRQRKEKRAKERAAEERKAKRKARR